MITSRERYLKREITHSDYYGELAQLLGEMELRSVLPLRRSPAEWRALIEDDQALNNVSLRQWDACDEFVRHLVRHSSRDALRDITGSGGWSLSDSVCVLKETARRYSLEEVTS